MSWKNQSVVELRRELVSLVEGGGLTVAEICRRFSVSRKTGYKWLTRFRRGGEAALADRVRSSVRLVNQTTRAVEAKITALRAQQPTWGPRKLRRRLQNLGHAELPAVSTFARILQREGLIEPRLAVGRWRRFSRSVANELWQMDFKGHFALQRSGRCHPLTVLDDCSRYLVGLEACADEQGVTVKDRLERLFQRSGLPESILCDNGAPWGGPAGRYTTLGVWLLRLGIRVLHGRPYHPQTQGKDERFHRTLQADLLARHDWRDLAQTQQRFNRYRALYNHDRPHQALDLAVPAERYQPSPRAYPQKLTPIEYAPGELVRVVRSGGAITFCNRSFYIGEAFGGLPVALRPTAVDGVYRVAFQAFSLGLIDLRSPNSLPKGNCYPLLPDPRKV